MPTKGWLTLSKSSSIPAMLIAIMINGLVPDDAEALTGREILTKLNTEEQVRYVSGVFEGLGYARFVKDRPDQTGSKCIQTWLTEDSVERWQIVKQWLEHHKEKTAGTILYALITKECGQ